MAVTSGERRLLVGDRWIDTGDWRDVRSPYSGDVVARVPWAGVAQYRAALDAAAAAMHEPLAAHERAAILDRAAALIEARVESFAATISAEAGKPIAAARLEAQRAVGTFTAAATAARTLAGEVVPMDAAASGAGKLGFTVRRPIGVAGSITPFNFPLNLVAHKVAPAIAAGCATVLKPSDRTPLAALELAALLLEAGLPDGWLNVVVGDPAAFVDELAADERVGVVTFTGSAPIGWQVRGKCPMKKVLLELGNATPAIVEADADLDDVVERLATSGFMYAGQACVSVQRALVSRDVYDRFVERFTARVGGVAWGDPAEESTAVGPVIDEAARDRILEWVEEARARGSTVACGGRAHGNVIEPTVIVDVPRDASLACREVFGPVVAVMPYDSLDEAIEIANDTPFGLQAGIFTRDIQVALEAASRLRFGGVTINETPSFRADHMPYGGIKQSGTGKEGPAWAAREMTEEQLVVIDLGSTRR